MTRKQEIERAIDIHDAALAKLQQERADLNERRFDEEHTQRWRAAWTSMRTRWEALWLKHVRRLRIDAAYKAACAERRKKA
jgi:hypothetical protein